MRLFATKRFGKDYNVFVKTFPDFKRNFEEFVLYKNDHNDPTILFGQKDGRMTAPGYKSFWRCHIIYGKAIVIYQPVDDELRLMCVTDHLALDNTGAGATKLRNYLLSIGDEDYQSVAPPDAGVSAVKASPDQIEALRHMIYEMAAHHVDRAELESFVAGTNRDALEYLRMALDGEPEEKQDSVIMAAFGDEAGLRKVISDALRATRVTEDAEDDDAIVMESAMLADRVIARIMETIRG